jgi:hypothetical protein
VTWSISASKLEGRERVVVQPGRKTGIRRGGGREKAIIAQVGPVKRKEGSQGGRRRSSRGCKHPIDCK